jgi:hypothetical protein
LAIRHRDSVAFLLFDFDCFAKFFEQLYATEACEWSFGGEKYALVEADQIIGGVSRKTINEALANGRQFEVEIQ